MKSEDPREQGKNITDPAAGQAEVRGGESPSDWTGPLPSRADVEAAQEAEKAAPLTWENFDE